MLRWFINKLRLYKQIRIIKKSGLFDERYYLNSYPDVRQADIDPIKHYILYGAKEGRWPNPDFDSEYYLLANPDVKNAGLNPLLHYILFGQYEGRKTKASDGEKVVAIQGESTEPKFLRLLRLINRTNIKKSIYYIRIYGLRAFLNKVRMKLNNTNSMQDLDLKIYKESYKKGYTLPFDGFKVALSKKIGVHVHLYYIDLLDEVIKYLRNIKYPYDLYITIPKNKSNLSEEIFSKTRKYLGSAKHIEIVVAENRGRNFAPFLVALRGKIDNYDYILHIHTKKSLYTGSSQDGWRKHLYEHLLGSELIVNNIIYLFETTNIGYISPVTYPLFPCWAHSWLSNHNSGRLLSERLGINFNLSKYADFSVGSMFWCKKDAIKQLFEVNFELSEFPEEPIPNDGTIIHAIERCFGELVRLNGYQYAEIDIFKGLFNIGFSSKNLEHYWSKSIHDLEEFVKVFNVISFDIFDTIVGRVLMHPDDLFRIINEILDSNIKTKICDFFKVRKLAENSLRQRLRTFEDVNIYQIYDELAKIANLNELEKQELMNLEIKLEKLFIRARDGIIDVVNRLIQGKRVILSSDMYLTSKEIKSLLSPFIDVDKVENRVSSETGLRKDRGDYWDKYKSEIQCHIGDNEHSDVQLCVDRSIPTFYIMSPRRMLELCNNIINTPPENLSPIDSIALGLSTYKLFSNPFALNKTNGNIYFDDPVSFGYAIFGPVFFHYILFLYKESLKSGINKLLFLAREGFYLEKLFRNFLKQIDADIPMDIVYLECSRRAMVMASLRNYDDIYNSLTIMYNASFSNLMYSRYGIKIDDSDPYSKEVLMLPLEKEKAKIMIAPYLDKILLQASIEREAYMEYLKSIGINYKDKIAVVDLGFSGTIQKYLQKLINVEIAGFYMITCHDNIVKRGLKAKSCFYEINCEDVPDPDLPNITKKSQILEAIMTAPNGQLERFIKADSGVIPVYKEHVLTNEELSVIAKIWEGINNYVNECTKLCIITGLINKDILPSKEVSMFYFDQFIENPKSMLSEEIKEIFHVDDTYVSNSTLKPIT